MILWNLGLFSTAEGLTVNNIVLAVVTVSSGPPNPGYAGTGTGNSLHSRPSSSRPPLFGKRPL